MNIGSIGRALVGAGACAAWLAAAGVIDLAAQQPGRPGGPAPAGQQPAGGRAGGAGQGRQGGGPPAPPPAAQAAAPTDLTGTWVAVVTEDWRWRMVMPPKGDAASIPATRAAIQASEQWDPAADIAAGEQCKAWGAPGVMRMPTRIRISWQDTQTLKLEFDNGTQTRLLHFDRAAQPPARPDYQGFSAARWETVPEGQGQIVGGGGRGGGPALSGGLKVVTTRMRPGYMRRNGIPYSANAVYTEAFDVTPGPANAQWLIVTSQLVDPQYLNQPYMLSSHFKREPDDSKFQPRPCEITPPVLSAPRTEGF
ncbi:MAG: hypothetical protein ABL986_04625 [Vicinamibacterales bacterium]